MLVILIGYTDDGEAVAGDIFQAENDRDAVAKALESESVLFNENVGGWRAFRYSDSWGPGVEIKAVPEDYTTDAHIKRRLESLRAALRAENISYGELHELQGLADHIEPGDVELLEPAGVSEEDAHARMDRAARPYVVGEVANPGVIERFATEAEASKYIEDSFDAGDVEAGRYYIDGPDAA